MITEISTDPAVLLSDKGNCVVVFYASWCKDCKRSEQYEKNLSKEFEGSVKFFRMDAVEYEPIADKYGVENYPTFVFFQNNLAIEGNIDEPESEDEIRQWLLTKISKN